MSARLAIAISGSVCATILALAGCAARAPGPPGAGATPGTVAPSTSATTRPPSSSPATNSPATSTPAPVRHRSYLIVTISEQARQPKLIVGGPPVLFTVTLHNVTTYTYGGITPLVSIGHCTCFGNQPVPLAPNGTLEAFDRATGAWRPVYYNKEGTGMDYLRTDIVQQPPIALGPGASVSFTFRIALTSQQPKPMLHAGQTPVDVTVIQPFGALVIGDTPAASVSLATVKC